jgi:hypothetical protein
MVELLTRNARTKKLMQKYSRKRQEGGPQDSKDFDELMSVPKARTPQQYTPLQRTPSSAMDTHTDDAVPKPPPKRTLSKTLNPDDATAAEQRSPRTPSTSSVLTSDPPPAKRFSPDKLAGSKFQQSSQQNECEDNDELAPSHALKRTASTSSVWMIQLMHPLLLVRCEFD